MLKPKPSLMALGVFLILAGSSGVCSAFTLLTKEQALNEAFWKGAVIETETKELTGLVLKNIREKLGGSLVFYQEGAAEQEVEEKTTYEFYFGVGDDGKRKGVAVIDTEPGKWGPVEYIVSMTVDGKIRSVKVMSYEETRGRPIARLSFMNQYRGKDADSTLEVGKDIIGISGATISSISATFTVKKVLVIYKSLYLK